MLRSSSTRRQSLLILTVLALALAALALKTDRAFMMAGGVTPVAPVFAGITVNTTVDEDNTGANCSLREAIVAANTDAAFGGCTAGSGSDVITVVATGTITLASALPDLSSSMQLNGPGATLLTVSGNNIVRVFNVTVGSPGAVLISGLTISNGNVVNETGGGIRHSGSGTLTVDGCILSGNSSTDPSRGGGGAISNASTGNITLSRSTLSGNSAPFGGGIYNDTGVVIILNSTLSGNSSFANGGGIFNLSGIISVNNTTLSGNSSPSGGGIYNNGTGPIDVINCTISGNTSNSSGVGGIRNFGSGQVSLRNSIVALNTGSDADVRGAMTSRGHNLIGTNGTSTGFNPGVSNPNGDLVGTDAAPLNPLLGNLANNGGLTQTRALLPGSLAIDAGDNCVLTNTCSPPVGFSFTTDQRGPGFNRSTDGNGDSTATVDIGAFEAPQVLIVTNTNDAGAGSLRQAITDANTIAGSDTIVVNIPTPAPGCASGVCTITIATPLPDLSTNIFINGPGANLLTVLRSEAPATPLFSIFSIPQNVTVAISGLTLSNANSLQNGGAIRNFGALTLTGLTLSNNQTSAGGSAIFNALTGTVTLTNSAMWENTAGVFAAIYNQGSTVSITNSTLAGNANEGSAPGSAIFSESNSITNVTSCTISENFGQGAVVQNGGGTGQVNLKNSIVAGNSGGNASGVTDQGNNLIGGFPLLGPLQINGGPTKTMALLPGSPALDAATDVTTMNGAIDNSVTTIDVTDGASIPAGVGFAIRIDNEQMVVTSKVNNTLTVTRGANGTTAASHAGGAGVNPAFDQRGAGFPRKADGSDANTTQTLDIGAFEAGVSVEDISNKSTNEDVALPTFTFNVGDAATPFDNIIATSSDPDLVPSSNIVVGPDTASTRTLSITPAANQSGFAVIVVTVTKGAQSMYDLFFLTVNEVNDAPSFTKGADQSVAEDSGPQTVPSWATAVSAGPPDESGQTLTFQVTGNTNPGLFSAGPAISSTGTLTYTPAANANGSATITIRLTDNGSGAGTSTSQSFVIAVTEINDTPTAANETISDVAEDSGERIILFGTLTANDSKGPANENGQMLVVKSVSNAVGGTVILSGGFIEGDGESMEMPAEIHFIPAANYYGPASFQYTVEDNGTTNGAADPKTSGVATASFNITAVADTPLVTNAGTNANTQTTSGLVISRNPADGAEVTHFKITGITGGSLFKNNGTTPINNGDFITFAEGNAGLKFTPGTVNGFFAVQASLSASDAGLGGERVLAAIIINPLGGVIRFSAANYSVAEGAGFRTITVERIGDTSRAATVDYASSDHSNPADFISCTSPGPGFASSRCDFTTAIGTLRFAAGETSKTFNVLISQDNSGEGTETLDLTLSNPTGGAVFGGPTTAILEITDDATEPATNPIDTASEFVRSQYHDFLNREPDGPGLAFWTDNIEKCNDPARRPAGQTVPQCIDKQRESTAVAFFMSPEFQMTGGFVYRLYKGSLTGVPNYDGGSPGRFPTSLEFMRDVSQVSEGIVVNNQIAGAVVEANRNRLAAEFVQRPEFLAKYGGLNNTLYVQELFNTTTITATASDKQALVDGLTNGTETRASVLRKVVDGTVVINEGNVQFTTTYGQAFYNQEYRRVFVFMEYVGYLRRNPDAAGFIFWLGKLNQYNGDPFLAEMVRSFFLSPEYRSRFGQP